MNKREHIKADKLFLGYTIPEMHRFIDDIESLKRYGPRHRIEKHDEKWLWYIDSIYGIHAYYIALLHILIDKDIIMDRKDLLEFIK